MSAAWKTVRVFISSTFKDMQAERDHLVRFVFPKLREELVTHRIHLVDVDLRWGVTSDQDALGVCREVIDECHPRFMCILGGRYGWVPEGKDKSITADEVHYGVLDREAGKRGHAFFYFRDDKATAEMVEEVAGEYREPEGSANADKLAALKQSIKDEGLPVVEYHAQWSAEQKRLVGLEEFGKRVHDDLLQSLKADADIAEQFTEDGSAALDEFADEAAQMEAFIEERTERYVVGSRDQVLKQMRDFAAYSGKPNIFVLTGDPGSGKSALLSKLVRQLQGRALSPLSAAADDRRVEDNAPYLLIPHFIGASTGSTDLRRTLRRLCHELAKAAGNTEQLPLDIKELITHFQKLLNEAAESGPLSPLSGSGQTAQRTVRTTRRIVLLFDALNQFDETDGAHWMNWLPRELPPGVRVIASVIAPVEGEKEHQTLAILRNRNDARVEALRPLDESDTQAIIEGYLKRYSKRLSPEQIAALKAKPASNLPLYILTALEELRTLGTYEEITTRIRDDLPGDTRALFGWILTKRLAHDPGFRNREGRPCGAALVEKFAACLGVSRHGLSPAELTALLDPGDPLGNVAALLRLLRPYLMRRGELLDFYHSQFREAVLNLYLRSDGAFRARREELALFFATEPPGARRTAELPWCLCRARLWSKLYQFISVPDSFVDVCLADMGDGAAYWAAIEANSDFRITEAYQETIQNPSRNSVVLLDCLQHVMRMTGHDAESFQITEFFARNIGQIQDPRARINLLRKSAVNLTRHGKLHDALVAHKQNESLAREHGLMLEVGCSIGEQALILYHLGKSDEALIARQKQREILTDLGNEHELLVCDLNTASVLKSLGRNDEAEAILRASLPETRRFRDWQSVAGCLQSLSLIEIQRGNFTSAESLLAEKEALCLEHHMRRELATCYNAYADICRQKHDFVAAINYLQRKEQICIETDDKIELALTWANLASIRGSALREYAEASRLIKQALNLAEACGAYRLTPTFQQIEYEIRQAVEPLA